MGGQFIDHTMGNLTPCHRKLRCKIVCYAHFKVAFGCLLHNSRVTRSTWPLAPSPSLPLGAGIFHTWPGCMQHLHLRPAHKLRCILQGWPLIYMSNGACNTLPLSLGFPFIFSQALFLVSPTIPYPPLIATFISWRVIVFSLFPRFHAHIFN